MGIQRLIARLQLKPAQSLALSFLGTILLGTVLLKLPFSSAAGKSTSLIDALFTATSATCVTGLVVVDTPTHFSTFGQVVILLLIQAGGLGIMTLSTSLALIFGRQMGLRSKLAMQNVLDQVDVEGMKSLILYILKMTLVIEVIGAVLLFLHWRGSFGELKAAYLAIFHSVSAFCNAGFSLFSNSFVSYKYDLVLNIIITFLIILGGIGFTVVADIQHTWFGRGRSSKPASLTIHTKLVLTVTALLLLVGTLAIFFGEYHNCLQGVPWTKRLLCSYFQSVTARTAGFNTLDIGKLTNVTLFIIAVLMFIGASPGSTGGGIKTSTVGILVLFVRAMFRGQEKIELFNRTAPLDVVRKAVCVTLLSAALVCLLMFPLLATQKANFIQLLFEAVSAFGTVGLSTGITPKLTLTGKLAIAFLIFAGRIGPLTVAFAVGRRRRPPGISYPEARVMVG